MNFRDILPDGTWFGGSRSGGMQAREEGRAGTDGAGLWDRRRAGGRDTRRLKGQDFVRSCRDNKAQTE